MTKKEKRKGNKLLKAYMGKPPRQRYNDDDVWYDGRFLREMCEVDRKDIPIYHKSFDWIMPVVKKIARDDFSCVDIHVGTGNTDTFAWCNIKWSNGINSFKTSEDLNADEQSFKMAIWKACVEFVEWYNANVK